jgi:hypothetical protein
MLLLAINAHLTLTPNMHNKLRCRREALWLPAFMLRKEGRRHRQSGRHQGQGWQQQGQITAKQQAKGSGRCHTCFRKGQRHAPIPSYFQHESTKPASSPAGARVTAILNQFLRAYITWSQLTARITPLGLEPCSHDARMVASLPSTTDSTTRACPAPNAGHHSCSTTAHVNTSIRTSTASTSTYEYGGGTPLAVSTPGILRTSFANALHPESQPAVHPKTRAPGPSGCVPYCGQRACYATSSYAEAAACTCPCYSRATTSNACGCDCYTEYELCTCGMSICMCVCACPCI